VKIGKNCLIAGLTGISGSCVIGDNVIMAGNVGIADNTTIQEDAVIAAKSGVIGLIRKGEIVWGYPAKPIREMKQQIATLSWITKNFDRLSKLMKQTS
jgi:UDP-3-O-[3-hydroxymyristoyl] glucosamine N-acyltransferase